MTMPEDVHVEVLVSGGCPNAQAAVELGRAVAERLGPGTLLTRVEVDTPEQAARLGFLGSPSFLVNGSDIEGKTTAAGALCCRTYADGHGLPPRWLLEAAVLRELRPRGLLFLCVANSARSQMAEGIARALLPAEVRVWSAGSHPTRVRPEAIAALKEIGIDISGHRSKHVSDVPATAVDTVITLCDEEECPVFLGDARRVHWGLPDPAAAGGSESERLDAFRRARDELRGRIAVLAGGNRREGQ